VFRSGWIQSLLAQLGADTVTYGGLDDGLVKLFTGPLTPTPATTLADLEAVEADYTGYGAATITTMGTVKPSALQWALFKSVYFAISGSGPYTGNEITGYWVETDEPNLVLAERFAAPVTLEALGDFLDLNVMVPLNLVVPVAEQE